MRQKLFSVWAIVMALVCVPVLSSCGGDDDDEIGGSGKSNSENVMYINGNNVASLNYGYFIYEGEGTVSFMFMNQNMLNFDVNKSPLLSFLSVRIPETSDIPTGTFTTEIDADFDVNRDWSTYKCDMTGWSRALVMTVSKSGNKYVIDVTSNDLHIFKSDNEIGDGANGSLRFHYEGGISVQHIDD